MGENFWRARRSQHPSNKPVTSTLTLPLPVGEAAYAYPFDLTLGMGIDSLAKRSNQNNATGLNMKKTCLLLIGLTLITTLVVGVSPAVAQSVSATSNKATAPAGNLEEQFNGLYGDSENQMPPGFPPYATTNPFRTIERVIAPLLTPCALSGSRERAFSRLGAASPKS